MCKVGWDGLHISTYMIVEQYEVYLLFLGNKS